VSFCGRVPNDANRLRIIQNFRMVGQRVCGAPQGHAQGCPAC